MLMHFYIMMFLIALLFLPTVNSGQSHEKPIDKNGFAVVELFTSQGCSSCPRADLVLATLAAENKDQQVFLLSLHVDYWDYLGWKDPFSSAEFSERQRWYASLFGSTRIYTPQMVINGRVEFVGSQATTARTKLVSAVQEVPSLTIVAGAEMTTDQNVVLNCQLQGKILPETLLTAFVVLKSAQNIVSGGENRGKNLKHVNIVRSIHDIEMGADKAGKLHVTRPPNARAEDLEIIVIVQSTSDGKIWAATKSSWPLQ